MSPGSPTPALHPPVCSLSLWLSVFQNVTLCEALAVWLLPRSDSSRLSWASVIRALLQLRVPCVDRPQRSPKDTRAVPVLGDCEERHGPGLGRFAVNWELTVTSLGEAWLGWAGRSNFLRSSCYFSFPLSTSTEQPGPWVPLIASASPHPTPRPRSMCPQVRGHR